MKVESPFRSCEDSANSVGKITSHYKKKKEKRPKIIKTVLYSQACFVDTRADQSQENGTPNFRQIKEDMLCCSTHSYSAALHN